MHKASHNAIHLDSLPSRDEPKITFKERKRKQITHNSVNSLMPGKQTSHAP